VKFAVQFCIAFAVLAGSLHAAEPGVLLREAELKSEPFIDASSVARLTRDLRVEILRRDGGWMEISVGRDRGWVRAVNVRREGVAAGSVAQSPVLALESGRAASKDLVTTTGIRSARVGSSGVALLPALDDEALKKVAADEKALKKLEGFGATAADARSFAGEAKLAAREVPYIPGSQPRPFLRGVEPATQQESEGSRQTASVLLGAIPAVRNDALQAYINRIGSWVAQQATGAQAATSPKWVFGVLDSPAPRTFTIPGNYIFVTRGLYDRLQNESELAALLGREIGHILKGTYLATLEKKNAVLTYSAHPSTEAEADRIGVVLATRAGYDAYGLPILLENLMLRPGPSRAGAGVPPADPLAERRATLERAMGTQFEAYGDGKTLSGRLVRNRT
jgi:hypothetical protein